MGLFGSLLGFWGFGIGISSGMVVGYFLFIYFQLNDVEEPTIQPLVEQDSKSLERLLPELPLWVDWLNRFIEYMWPYLNKAICKTTKDIAKPIIAEYIGKFKIESIEFESLTLGSFPPTFQGIKAYDTDEKELMMEPSLTWAGNPNVIVAIKAFGLKATVQVVDLQLSALPRLTLKPLVPSFPCFAKILVSLMEKPYVDFGLKLGGQISCQFLDFTILFSFRYKPLDILLLQEILKDQVSNMYLWPKTLEVQIMDPAKAARKPVGILHVKVVRASNLKKKDLMGKSDPYVKLKLTDDRLPSKKTTVKHSNLNPEWNEEFTFVVKDPDTQALELTVYDWEQVGRHEKMGMNMIPLKELPPNEKKPFTLDLLKTMDPNDPQNEKSRGQLVVEATYKPFEEEDIANELNEDSGAVQKAPEGTPSGGGLLVVILHGAEDVEGKHHTNPYARILFSGEERKTKHVKKNRNPRWEEEFQFMLDEPPVNDKLHVEVISKPSSIGIHSKETLGYVDTNLADVVTNKRINEKFHLIDSKNGKIHIELQWRI